MNTMIPIEEAIQANDRTIGAMLLIFALFAIVALVVTLNRRRMVNRRIRKAVDKAVTKAVEDTKAECNEKSLENFIHWMDTRIELKKVKRERDDLKRKYEILYKAAEGCPGVTAAKIEN